MAGYLTVPLGDHWITYSRSGVPIATTEPVDGCWETKGRMVDAHRHRFEGASAEEAIRNYLSWGGYLPS